MIRLEVINTHRAKRFVADHHYAVDSPPTVKLCHGLIVGGCEVGVALWGYGVRPLHTIKRLFPSLGTNDYWELCRFCVLDEMPANTETQFLRLCIKSIKTLFPQIKVILSWADGMRGKPGYIYQAANFLYGGYIKSEFYTDAAGQVIHPRLLITRYGTRTKAKQAELGLTKYWGRQFRYITFLCSHKERKRLLAESPFIWGQNYPKAADLQFEKQAGEGSRESCQLPMLKGSGQFRHPAPLFEGYNE